MVFGLYLFRFVIDLFRFVIDLFRFVSETSLGAPTQLKEMISMDNFFVFLRLLFFAVLLLYVT